MYTLLVTQAVACHVSESELAWFLMCTLLVTDCDLSYFRWWFGLVFNVHSSGDADCGLSCFRWWVSLVLNVNSSGDTDCGLSCFRGWVGLVLNVHSSCDTNCDLSCFRGWVGLVFNVHFSGDIDWACYVSDSELAWFLMCSLLVTQTGLFFFQHVSWPGF